MNFQLVFSQINLALESTVVPLLYNRAFLLFLKMLEKALNLTPTQTEFDGEVHGKTKDKVSDLDGTQAKGLHFTGLRLRFTE